MLRDRSPCQYESLTRGVHTVADVGWARNGNASDCIRHPESVTPTRVVPVMSVGDVPSSLASSIGKDLRFCTRCP